MADLTPTTKPLILIVEDDKKLADLVADFLKNNGFVTKIETRGDRAIERIIQDQPDLVVLDVMLPGAGGLEVCRQVRTDYSGPILMLTALGEEDDEVLGLETGADGYLAKPVRPRVLLSHIQALLRRNWQPKNDSELLIDMGAILISQTERSVQVHGNPINLTAAEFDLLWLLATNKGEPVTREHIFQELRGIPYDGLDRTIDLRINRIRYKLGDDGRIPIWIKSVRGTGYLLVAHT